MKDFRVCVKDIDTRKILLDTRLHRGQTYCIPEGYKILFTETNELGEEWTYVKKDKR